MAEISATIFTKSCRCVQPLPIQYASEGLVSCYASSAPSIVYDFQCAIVLPNIPFRLSTLGLLLSLSTSRAFLECLGIKQCKHPGSAENACRACAISPGQQQTILIFMSRHQVELRSVFKTRKQPAASLMWRHHQNICKYFCMSVIFRSR